MKRKVLRLSVAEHNQRCECTASDNIIEETGRGPVEVSRAVEAVVEDQKLLW